MGPPPMGPPPIKPPPMGPPPSYPPPPPAFGAPAPYVAPPPPRGNGLTVLLAVLAGIALVAGVVTVPLVLAGRDDDARGGDAGATLEAVAVHEGLTFQHLAAGEQADYPQSPPVGGDHAPYWLDCGVYDQVLPEEAVVHDLEHGTVVLHHIPDLEESDRQLLASKLPDNGIMAPYPGLRAPVIVTVWGRQLELLGADDPRLDRFVAEYGHGETAPEPFASCHGGVSPEDVEQSGVSAKGTSRR